MFKHKTWRDKAEELSFYKEEYDFVYSCNEKRMQENDKMQKCRHGKKVYLKHLSSNQMWIMLCDDCGEFSPIMCGHGGSGYMCPECINKLAKEVVIL